MTSGTPPDSRLEALAAELSASADYRVLRRLRPLDVDALATAGASPTGPVRRALVLDVETTGLSQATDSIIELGVILFSYDGSTGRVLQVLAAESWLQDPGRPIPETVARLTGITDDDVRGQQIDEARLRELTADVGLIIAHNAAFDRPFIDRRFPFLAQLHWGCSMSDVPWQARNHPSQKLEFLLYTHTQAFLDTHHRALDDCRATLHVLATAFDDNRTPLELLLHNCRQPRARIAAVRSPFETKDILRQRGYGWSGEAGTPPKTWCREVAQTEVDAELDWLREQVYGANGAQPLVEKVDLRSRYSAP